MLIVRQVKTSGEAWGDVGRAQAPSGGTASCSWSTGVPAGGGGEVHLRQWGRKAQVLECVHAVPHAGVGGTWPREPCRAAWRKQDSPGGCSNSYG